MTKENIRTIVTGALEEFLAENGYELYDVKFVKEAKDWFLRIYIEKQAGETEEYISVDDCEKVSRFLGARLDEKDPISQNYYLEVSSPGMDRELIKERDYQRFVGKEIEVRLYKAADGIKKIKGTLERLEGSTIVVVSNEGHRWELELKEIAKANLALVF